MKKRLYILLFLLPFVCNAQIKGIKGIKGIEGIGAIEEGIDTFSFQSIQTAVINQVSLTFQTTSNTDSCTIDWGNGDVERFAGTTDQTLTSNYLTNNTTYNIDVYDNIENISEIIITSEPTLSGINSSDLVNMPLTFFRIYNSGTDHMINSADFSEMSLEYFNMANCGVNNTINSSDFVGMPLINIRIVNSGTNHVYNSADFSEMPLEYFFIYLCGTNHTGQLSDFPETVITLTISESGTGFDITTGTMKAWANTDITITPSAPDAYSTTQIDAFLNAYAATAAAGVATIDLRGNNQARSSVSDAAVTTLNGLNKTILTNP